MEATKSIAKRRTTQGMSKGLASSGSVRELRSEKIRGVEMGLRCAVYECGMEMPWGVAI